MNVARSKRSIFRVNGFIFSQMRIASFSLHISGLQFQEPEELLVVCEESL